jgi:general secretion pathway protein G
MKCSCKKDIRLAVDTFVALILVLVFAGVLIHPCGYGRCEGSNDAKLSNLMTNLQSVRAQLELYKLHHKIYPTDVAVGLTSKTNADGTINKSGAYGPYMKQFPANPYVDDLTQALKTSGVDGEGWSYDSATGTFAANTAGHEKNRPCHSRPLIRWVQLTCWAYRMCSGLRAADSDASPCGTATRCTWLLIRQYAWIANPLRVAYLLRSSR